MASVPTEALGAIGAVVAALIAGVISLLGLVISKEHKVSDFRQAWNDALREDVALLITHMECLRGAHAAQPDRPPWADRKDHFIAINRAITAVRLRVDPDFPRHQAFLQALTEMENAAQEGNIATSERIGPAVEALTEASRNVIREEWALIRRGEGVYLWSRYAAVGIIIAALVILLALVPAWVRAERNANAAVQSQPLKLGAQAAPETKVFVFLCNSPSPHERRSGAGLVDPCRLADSPSPRK
jgi:hypothetical protein